MIHHLSMTRVTTLAVVAAATTLLDAPPARADEAPNACTMPTPNPWSRRFAPPSELRAARLLRSPVMAQPAPVRRTRPHTAPPPVVAGAAAPPSQEVWIEVHDSAPGRPRQVERFTLPLTRRGDSRVETGVGAIEYRVSVHRQGDDANSPLGFDIQRMKRGPESATSEARVRASVRMQPRKRVIIARVVRSDGSRTEVLATLK